MAVRKISRLAGLTPEETQAALSALGSDIPLHGARFVCCPLDWREITPGMFRAFPPNFDIYYSVWGSENVGFRWSISGELHEHIFSSLDSVKNAALTHYYHLFLIPIDRSL